MEKKKAKRQWGIPLLIIAIFVINLSILFATRNAYPSISDFLGNVVWVLASFVFAVVGGLILVRQRRHVIGWLLMVLPLMVTFSAILDLFLRQRTLAATQLDALGFFYLWFGGWSWWLLIGPLLLILLLYPTGHLRSKRWRWVVFLLIATFLLFLFIATFTATAVIQGSNLTWANPIGFLSDANVQFLLGLMSPMLVVTVIASVVSVFIRYRNSQAVERAQMRWLFLAGAFFMIVYVPGFILPDDSVWSTWFGYLFLAGVVSIPISIGFAILRYRLWDIDVVINRSLVYGVLTTLLAAIFAGSAALLTQAAKAAFGTNMEQASVAIAAVFVASLFQPLRNRVEDGINRRLFPENIDLGQGLIELNPDLWNWMSLPRILDATLDHVQGIYSCDGAAIYLKKNNEYEVAAALGISKSALPPFNPSPEQQDLLAHKKGIVTEGEKPFEVTIPLYLARRKAPELLGVLRLGKRPQGRGYSGDDVKTLSTFGSKLAQPIYAFSAKYA